MESLQNLGVFAGQAFVILFVVATILILIAILIAKSQIKPELEIELLHEKYQEFSEIIKKSSFSKEELKKDKKDSKKKTHSQKVFVIDFDGDIRASAVDHLREEVSAILSVAQTHDEVVVRLESPGGMVHTYGLAASQLMRIRDKKIPLTVCVDKVAASGGYMIACTANRLLSAPFAIIGSIGVIAQVPNFHRFLKKHDVDYKEYTAGEFKRTVSLMGEITPKAEEKFREQIESTHGLFKSFVHRFRPHLDLSQVSTGEYWYGEQAIHMGLVDELRTSDDYLLSKIDKYQIIKVKYLQKQKLSEKLSHILGQSLSHASDRIINELEARRWI